MALQKTERGLVVHRRFAFVHLRRAVHETQRRLKVGVDIAGIEKVEQPIDFVRGLCAELTEPLEGTLPLGFLPRQRFFLRFYVVCRRVYGWRAITRFSLGHGITGPLGLG
jgi:hypothetical protein